MKNALILLLAITWMNHAESACSSQISRTNSSALTTLTASKYNTDINTVYSRVNELPGDCITDETVTSAKIVNGTIVAADLASGAVTQAKLGAVNAIISTSSGSFTMTSATYADVTNLTASITTTGRPVEISFISGYFSVDSSISINASMEIKAVRGVADVDGEQLLGVTQNENSVSVSIPASGVRFYDAPAAGTYTYKIQVRRPLGSTAFVTNVKMLVREL